MLLSMYASATRVGVEKEYDVVEKISGYSDELSSATTEMHKALK